MDHKKTREIYVSKLVESIPAHIKPVDYLMDVLNISRISAYRRLNCVVPFTYDEIMALSLKLDISLDEIIHSNASDKAVFSFQNFSEPDPERFYYTLLDNYYRSIVKEGKANTRSSILAMNHLWILFAISSEELVRFYYYKWLNQTYERKTRLHYSEVPLPPEIAALSRKIWAGIQELMDTTFIIDRNLFLNTMKEIQYYYHRNFIEKDELEKIAKGVEFVIDYTEEHVLRGINKVGSKRNFYYSLIDIYSNSLYAEYDGKSQSLFYGANVIPFSTTNMNICASHKKWLESLKKYAVLMTASNETLQIHFFKKQREYLDNLLQDVSLFT